MNPDQAREQTLLQAALALEPGAEREAFLEIACADAPGLRQRILELLAAHQEAELFFQQPAAEHAGLPRAEPAMAAPAKLCPEPAQGQRIGRFKLLEKIGEGGCGVVYVAEQEEPVRRRVALKVIKLGMDTRLVVARFEAERQALAMMDHPNIAKVLEAGATETGRPYFVMELVRGLKVTDYCDRNRLSIRERLDLFMSICSAVQHAHQKGIIHRDLKPSNILVTLSEGAAVPKVIDFGIAKATEGRLTDKTVYTEYHQFIGTPAYMSPEQAELTNENIDTRSDIYSLGVLLYELLTSKTPFGQEDLLKSGLDAMRHTIRTKEPARPSTRLSTLSAVDSSTIAKARGSEPPRLIHLVRGDLDWIVMKCLEKDRNRRYETANGLARDLERHLNHEPVVARPPSNLYRLQKLVQRNTLLLMTGATVVLALLAGTALASWQAVQASRERKQAQADAKRAEAGASEVRLALERSDFLQADHLISSGAYPDAVPHLSRILSSDPTNYIALSRLATLLTYHSWMVPTLILKHRERVNDARFSPDGGRIVTASDDNTAQVWDATTGRALTQPLRHEGRVRTAQFSPDGNHIVTASADRTARVWDAVTGQPLTGPLRHEDWVASARFSPDGKRIVTASFDHTARVWDARTGQPLTGSMKHRNHVFSAEFSPDGKRVITASEDHTACVWDAQTGQLLTEPLQNINWIYYAEFSPDGKRILTASIDRPAQVWDAQTGKVLTTMQPGGIMEYSARFSPDGKGIVTASYDHTAQVWDAQTGQPLTPPLRHGALVWRAEFSPDGTRVATASYDDTTQVWDAQTGQPLTPPLQHAGHVVSVQFSPDGQRVLTASEDNTAQVWDTPLGGAVPEQFCDRTALGNAVGTALVVTARFSPDGKRVVTTSDNGAARVWDAQTGVALTSRLEHKRTVFDAQFSPDGERIVTTSADQTARVWDAQTGRPITGPLQHSNWVTSAEFGPDGKRVLTASWDRTARIWDAVTGQMLMAFSGHTDYLAWAHFSPDGKRVVTSSWDNTARVWDAQTGQPLTPPLTSGDRMYSAQFSPDGKRIVTASWDGTARVWDAQTGQPLTPPLRHRDRLNSAEFSPDGKRIVTAARDRTGRVWNAQTGQPLTEPMKHDGELTSAQFSVDGKRIVTRFSQTDDIWLAPAQFSPDGNRILTASSSAQVWDARTGEPLTEPLRYPLVPSSRVSGKTVDTSLGQDLAARLWDVGFVPRKLPAWLLPLAEAFSGERLNSHGDLEQTTLDRAQTVAQIRTELNSQPTNGDGVLWGRWLLSNPLNRRISPLCLTTVSNYVENRIEENTQDSLDEAATLAYGNSALMQRISHLRRKLMRVDQTLLKEAKGLIHRDKKLGP